MLSLHLDLKIIFSIQYGKFPSLVHLSLILKSSEVLAKYRKTQVYTPFYKLRNKGPFR